MNTIKVSLIVIALLIVTGVNAQNKPLTFGVRAGMNISNVRSDFEDTKARFGINAGVTADYMLAPNIYLLTGLDFTNKGSKISNDPNLKLNLSYIQLPVHAGYKFPLVGDTHFVLHAGPYLAFATDGKWKMKGESVDAFSDNAESVGLKLKRFDFGLAFGIGAEFGKINAGINCDLGLVNIADSKAIQIDGIEYGGSIKNMSVSLSLGYKF